ncbi:hypothetical protein OAU32_01005 [bacterium]|nr:hypothetical protein [bacterium]
MNKLLTTITLLCFSAATRLPDTSDSGLYLIWLQNFCAKTQRKLSMLGIAKKTSLTSSGNSLGVFSMYVLAEFILVVVGILVAVSINN